MAAVKSCTALCGYSCARYIWVVVGLRVVVMGAGDAWQSDVERWNRGVRGGRVAPGYSTDL